MRCDQRIELMALQRLGLLDPEEEAALRQHLDSGCPRCNAELASAREILDLLPYGAPLEEPSPAAKARLMASVGKDRPPGIASSAARQWPIVAPLAAAIVVGLLTGVLMERRQQAVTAGLLRQIESQREELASLKRQVGQARQTIQLVSSPGVKVIDLAGQGERTDSAARVFWDRRRASWQLYADNLPPAGSGKTYQLWLITAGAKFSAGTFDPAPAGEASGSVSVPAEAGTVLAAAVTDEPEGGSPQPTGQILLLGKI